ncbi:MAG: hypothetical protein ACO3NK_17170 [Prochlorotrichaceae cyanobacterium]|jgi:hypothetical protein
MFIKFLNARLNLSTVGSIVQEPKKIRLNFPDWVMAPLDGQEWEDGEGSDWCIYDRDEDYCILEFTPKHPAYAKIIEFFS